MRTFPRRGDTKRRLRWRLFACVLVSAPLTCYLARPLSSDVTRAAGRLLGGLPYVDALTRRRDPLRQPPQLGATAQQPEKPKQPEQPGSESSPDFEQKPIKLIVAWTSYFSQLFERVLKNEYLNECAAGSRATCRITSNRSLVQEASAVLFHARDLDFGRLPPTRAQGQFWILVNLESPANAGITSEYDDVFNLTMTYRNDSDLPLPYGYFSRRARGGDEPTPQLARRKSAYWLVSNCAGSRMTYVRRLMQHVDIDIFGKCSGSEVPRLKEYEEHLRSRYAFYLAFENSQCTQYITEKLWKTLSSSGGAIPLVLGAPLCDYEAQAPPNSFVHVDNFSSPSELGKFIKEVASSEDLFAFYHGWRREYTAYGSVVNKYRRAICNLCDKLHAPARRSRTTERLSKWFNTGCRT